MTVEFFLLLGATSVLYTGLQDTLRPKRRWWTYNIYIKPKPGFDSQTDDRSRDQGANHPAPLLRGPLPCICLEMAGTTLWKLSCLHTLERRGYYVMVMVAVLGPLGGLTHDQVKTSFKFLKSFRGNDRNRFSISCEIHPRRGGGGRREAKQESLRCPILLSYNSRHGVNFSIFCSNFGETFSAFSFSRSRPRECRLYAGSFSSLFCFVFLLATFA